MVWGETRPCSVEGCPQPGGYRGPTGLWLCDEHAPPPPLRGTCDEEVGDGVERRRCANRTAVVDPAGRR